MRKSLQNNLKKAILLGLAVSTLGYSAGAEASLIMSAGGSYTGNQNNGGSGNAVTADYTGSATLSSSTVTATGSGAQGIYAGANAKLTLTNVNINASSTSGAGRALSAAVGSYVVIDGTNTWDSTGHSGTGAASETIRTDGTLETLAGSSLTLKVNNDNGVEAINSNVTIRGIFNIEKTGATTYGGVGYTTNGINTFTSESNTTIKLGSAVSGTYDAIGYNTSNGTTTIDGKMNITLDCVGKGMNVTGGTVNSTGTNSDVKITLGAANSIGVHTSGGSTTATFKSLNITGAGDDIVGVNIDGGSTQTITGGSITLIGSAAHAIDVVNGTLNMSNFTMNSTNVTNGNDVRGITLTSGTANLSGTNNINVNGGDGARIEDGTNFNITGTTNIVSVNTFTYTADKQFSGIENNGKLNIGNSTTAGILNISYGRQVGSYVNDAAIIEYGNGKTTVANNSELKISLTSANVMGYNQIATTSDLEIGDNAKVTITGSDAGVTGMKILGKVASSTSSKTDIALSGGGTGLYVTGAGSNANLNNVKINVSGANPLYGIDMRDNSNLTIQNLDLKASVATATTGRGVSVIGGSKLKLSGTNVIDTTGGIGDVSEAMYVSDLGTTFDVTSGSLTLKSSKDCGIELVQQAVANINGKFIAEKSGNSSNGGGSTIAVHVANATMNFNAGSAPEIKLGAGATGVTALNIIGTTVADASVNTVEDLKIESLAANSFGIKNTSTDTKNSTYNAPNGKTTINMQAGGTGIDNNGAKATATMKDLAINGSGAATTGIDAKAGSTLEVTNGADIKLVAGGTGASVGGAGTTADFKRLGFVAESVAATGLSVTDAAYVKAIDSEFTLSAGGTGISMANANSLAELNHIVFNSTNITAIGADISDEAQLVVDGSAQFTIAKGGTGIHAWNGGLVNIANVNITGTSTVDTTTGILADTSSKVGLGEVEINLGKGRGIHVNNDAELWIEDIAIITTANDGDANSNAIVAENGSTFKAENSLSATAGGTSVIEGYTGATLDFEGLTLVKTLSNTREAAVLSAGATMNFKENLHVDLDGDNIVGIAASVGYNDDATTATKINIEKQLSIVSPTGENTGIQAGELGETSAHNDITVQGDVILDMGDGHGVAAINDSTIKLLKNVAIKTNNKVAVAVGGDTADALVEINQAGGNTVQIEGDLIGEGSKAGSEMNIKMDDSNSYLTGKATRSLQKINLDVLGGSEWNVTGDSQVTKLSNEGIVNMMYNADYQTITTKELAGAGGEFRMKTDLQKSWDAANVYVPETDRLIIEESSSGDHVIVVEDASLGNGNPAAGYLLLVEDRSGGTATFTGSTIETGGIWKYNTIITDENPDTALETRIPGGIYGTEVLGHPDEYAGVPASSHNWYLAGYDRTNFVSGNAKANLGMAESLYGSLRAGFLSDDTLLKRLGEMRHINTEKYEGGVWARVKGIKNDMDGEEITGMKTTLLQVGYDKGFEYENKKVVRGLAVDYARNTFDNASTTEGNKGLETSTDTKSNSLGLSLYSTTLRDSGHYLDLVAKVGRISTSMDYVGAKPESNDVKNWTYAASVEYGRKNKNEKTGWYVEPQVQLAYGFTKGMDYTTQYGINVKTDSVQSLVGRTGFVIGKESFDLEKGTASNYYLKAFVLREFLGKADISMTDNFGDSIESNQDMSSTWGVIGLGTTMNLNEKTHLYADVEKSFGGGSMKTKWAVNVGMKWSF